MCRVYRPALCLVRRRRIGQLDVLGRVVGGEHRLAVSMGSVHGHTAVFVGARHDPPVTVLDPPAAGWRAAVRSGV